MFSHNDIWSAIDRLAEIHTTSPSGLAKLAGLDPTTFNKSKRITSRGKARWPSTESVAKVLSVLSVEFETFAHLASGHVASGRVASARAPQAPAIPVIGLAQAGSEGFFDDAGFPVGGGWEEVRVPDARDKNLYALEIAGDSMSPVLRRGDRIVVAPNQSVRKGDRVVVKTRDGEIMAKELFKLTQTTIELISLNSEYEDRTLNKTDILWIARIIWVSQ